MSTKKPTRGGAVPPIKALDPIERMTLGDRVHGQLSDLLVSGQLAPGETLTLRSIAATLGVSIMPVREAVTRLMADGALEVLPNRSIRVPPMSAAVFGDLARARIEIEGFAASLAATGRTAADLDAIARAERAFADEAALPEPDPARVISLNKEFHFAIYAAAGSPVLMSIISGLWLKAGPVINLDFRSSRKRLASGGAVRRHARAAQAVGAGDADLARAAIAEDIRSAADFILAQQGKEGWT